MPMPQIPVMIGLPTQFVDSEKVMIAPGQNDMEMDMDAVTNTDDTGVVNPRCLILSCGAAAGVATALFSTTSTLATNAERRMKVTKTAPLNPYTSPVGPPMGGIIHNHQHRGISSGVPFADTGRMGQKRISSMERERNHQNRRIPADMVRMGQKRTTSWDKGRMGQNQIDCIHKFESKIAAANINLADKTRFMTFCINAALYFRRRQEGGIAENCWNEAFLNGHIKQFVGQQKNMERFLQMQDNGLTYSANKLKKHMYANRKRFVELDENFLDDLLADIDNDAELRKNRTTSLRSPEGAPLETRPSSRFGVAGTRTSRQRPGGEYSRENRHLGENRTPSPRKHSPSLSPRPEIPTNVFLDQIHKAEKYIVVADGDLIDNAALVTLCLDICLHEWKKQECLVAHANWEEMLHTRHNGDFFDGQKVCMDEFFQKQNNELRVSAMKLRKNVEEKRELLEGIDMELYKELTAATTVQD